MYHPNDKDTYRQFLKENILSSEHKYRSCPVWCHKKMTSIVVCFTLQPKGTDAHYYKKTLQSVFFSLTLKKCVFFPVQHLDFSALFFRGKQYFTQWHKVKWIKVIYEFEQLVNKQLVHSQGKKIHTWGPLEQVRQTSWSVRQAKLPSAEPRVSLKSLFLQMPVIW